MKETNIPRSYRTSLPHLHSFFSRTLHSYHDRIGLIPSTLCPSCRREPHTSFHVLSCPSHPTPMTVRNLWKRPHLTSKVRTFLVFLSLISHLFLPLPLSPLLLTGMRIRSNYHHESWAMIIKGAPSRAPLCREALRGPKIAVLPRLEYVQQPGVQACHLSV